MTDFTLRPAARTPGAGRDFRLVPGYTGAAAEIAVGGGAVAPVGRASGLIQVSTTQIIGGGAVAPVGLALGAVAIHRFIAVQARAPWTGLATHAPVRRANWPGLAARPLSWRARWGERATLAPVRRAHWPGLPSIQAVRRAVWGGLTPLSASRWAHWPGLPSIQAVRRVVWSAVQSQPSAPVRAVWPALGTVWRWVRARWGAVQATPSAPVRARWNDLRTPWIRFRIRWGRLITPRWVWPRPPGTVEPVPVPPFRADTFRLFLRARTPPPGRDFRLFLGAPFLITALRSLLMRPTVHLYRLSDNLPLVGASLTLSSDRSSYGWSATLTTPDAATVEALFTSDPPASFGAVINGHTWHLQPLSYQQTRAFGQRGYTIPCNSRTALLDAPFATASAGVVAASLTAHQIADAIVAGTGFTVQWDLPVDWAIPAGRHTWTAATPKTRLSRLAEAVGATLQSPLAGDTLILTPRYPLAPWEWAGQTPALVLSGLITDATLGLAQAMPYDSVYVSGTDTGVLAQVKLTGAPGERPAAMVTDAYLTEVLANRERGRQVLAAAANQKSLSVTTVLNTAPNPPGVVVPGTLVELIVDAVHWLDLVMSCTIEVRFGQVTQTLGFGEGRGNAFARFRRLLPTDPLLTGTVIATWEDETSTVEVPGGGEIRVAGAGYAIGQRVFVQGGKIQDEAPELPGAAVEV